MKLTMRDLPGFVTKPDAAAAGVLIYGADPMRIALRRQELLKNLLGPMAEEEMRLSRILGADLKKDPAWLGDALRASGFFPGARAALVEDVTEVQAGPVLAALEDWQEGDAQIIVTAGALKPASKLRKAFEGHSRAYAAAIYAEPPSRTEIADRIKAKEITPAGKEAEDMLHQWGRQLAPGDFDQLLEKLSLYLAGDAADADAISACAPQSTEAALDDVLHVIAEARTPELPRLFSRLAAQGVQPVALCIAALRHFKTLHRAASDPGGVGQGMGKLRPPVFGPRRDQMQRQASKLGRHRLEQILQHLSATDLALRSAGQTAPAMALVERCFIRIAKMGERA